MIVQSVPITTKVVSSSPAGGEVYSIQLYVIKFVSDLWQVGGFLRVLRFPPPRNNWNTVESDVKHHNPIWNKVIGGVMVSVLASSAVNSRFKPRSGQTKDSALKSKNKD
jgi:hypothetical protein